jgi:hypothetical protein
MGVIVVERSFEAPVSYEEMDARERAVAWCFEQHRVTALRSFLSRDRTRAVCIYDAADAESVRITQREGGLPFDRVWPAETIEPDDRERPARYSAVVVQRALPAPVDVDLAWTLLLESADCHRNHRAKLWTSYLSRDGTRMVCHYYAPDAESVRNASLESELPMEAAWPATGFGDVPD